VLKRQLERARRLGYQVLLASELEFYLFANDQRDARARGFRGLQPTTIVRSDYSIVGQAVQEPFIARLRREMDAAEIPIYACQAEYGFGQWEVNLDYADALEMADRHLVYKAGVKELALQAGLTVTFMAKPFVSEFGSSGHVHCSLRRDARPVFPREPGARHLSATGLGFLGGLTRRLSETALLLAPYVNSYKRHTPDSVGGGIIAWGLDNRTVTFRVIGSGESLRIEHRYPGADVNPYLAAAAIVAAGLEGIEQGADPGPPFVGNAYQHPELPHAPASLGQAVEVFETSDFVAGAFGEDVRAHYAAHARGEWNGYLRAVTDWELDRAFEQA
jgi:glutamine synthetase